MNHRNKILKSYEDQKKTADANWNRTLTLFLENKTSKDILLLALTMCNNADQNILNWEYTYVHQKLKWVDIKE